MHVGCSAEELGTARCLYMQRATLFPGTTGPKSIEFGAIGQSSAKDLNSVLSSNLVSSCPPVDLKNKKTNGLRLVPPLGNLNF